MSEYAIGPIFMRDNWGAQPKGHVIETGVHNFDHISLVIRGSALCEILDAQDNVIESVTKKATDVRNYVLIVKGARHRFTYLEDGTIVQCWFTHRDPMGNVVQEYDGWLKGNT